ncbi:response regulator [uncultured Acetobacterium sp.]|uniref:response regulator n=1 Tax=uncultured Acetobacterium sp. TaxID=217139 RepID=UPI0025F99EF1|nr:response regulator [uncultured Acetobacterium sp.]
MWFRNMKISIKLSLGFAIILVFVLIIGVVAYVQTELLNQQTVTMYNHPLQVRRAIDSRKLDVSDMRIGMRDLLLSENDQEEMNAIQAIELASLDAEKQFEIIKKQYLGSQADFDELYQNYTKWKIAHDKNVNLVLSGEREEAKNNILDNEVIGSDRNKLLASIDNIDKFAQNKSDSLYQAAVVLKKTLNTQIVIITAAILLLSILIVFALIRSVSKPLDEMNTAIMHFHNGDMTARSPYESKNEFGVLSSSLNKLAEQVQVNTDLNDKMTRLSKVMLSEDNDRIFFQSILAELAEHTGAQIAAVYLLNENKKTFEHFESIGTNEKARQSFAADLFEGEFGAAILSQKLQHIKNIPAGTSFEFQTVSGKYVPREIITIPVATNKHVIAIISLATVNRFTPQAIELINKMNTMMSTRIEGILAYRKIREYGDAIAKQNQELVTQKNELSAQAAELAQQNTELEMQKNQLNEASKLKTNFLSNMSHELRTPLNSVIALSGLLNRKLANKIPDTEYSYLEIIERNGKNLLMLINDVLDISRIESGREEIEITKFNANNIISEVVSMIQLQAKQKSIKLIHNLSDNKIEIISDAYKCHHIIQNLIGNAVKFTEKGSVTVSAQQKENNIEIRVADTGIGIAAEQLPHVFDEFRQADGSTSRRFGGTGLGLAIAKKYANLLGGTIEVKSALDEGSEFTLSLPMRYAVENKIVSEENISKIDYEIIQPFSEFSDVLIDKNILQVEDNESAVIQIGNLVEEMGHRIVVAQDAGEAFAIIDKQIPDAMILDLMMPGIDGFRVLELLRNAQVTAHIPVLILTAKHVTKDELKFLKRNNVHELIQKGDVDRKRLQNAISGMLSPETPKKEKPQNHPQSIEGKPVIMVIEDNVDNMITIKALLSDHYTVIEAIDGYEGIEKAKAHIPNLILMDIALPGISGIEAYHEIRKMPKLEYVPIIALTASAMDHDREAVLAHGFDAFIAKPIIIKEFLDVINEVLYGK